MMNDSVREELKPKIMLGGILRPEAKAATPPLSRPATTGPAMFTPAPAITVQPSPSPVSLPVRVPASKPAAAPPPVKRTETADLIVSKTSPTLVDFQNKNAAMPDWRIQLQNTVRQRAGGGQTAEAVSQPVSAVARQFPTVGAAALKAEVVSQPEPAQPKPATDPRLAAAMKRIEDSRKTFLKTSVRKEFVAPKPAQARPFGVVTPNLKAPAASTPAATPSMPMPDRPVIQPRPTLVPSMPLLPTLRRDTNKLPPIEIEAKPEFEAQTVEPAVIETEAEEPTTEFAAIKRIRIRAEPLESELVEDAPIVDEEIEDLAPFSMRFGAGLFDVIIGSFTSMLLLSPIAFTNGNWFTLAGLLTFLATCAIVMFVYMTICLGFSGKTIGMRLFSLELVDASENEYPTLHQAAVNSAVYILSLVFGGAGFLTIFFNEEKRAAHDLLSGTILVREF